MKSIKFIILATTIFLNLPILYGQTHKIYVSATGNDNDEGSIESPKLTLRGAYDEVGTLANSPNEIDMSYQIILKNDGDILLDPNRLQLKWEKSGTSTKSIKIKPEFDSATITRLVANASGSHIIKLENVNNFHIKGVKFKQATLAFNLVNVDNSSIRYCLFKGNPLQTANNSGSGCIIMEIPDIAGHEFDPINWKAYSNMKSENNVFEYNKFEDLKITNDSSRHRFHAFYISRGSLKNYFHGNTILYPPGNGITFNHGFQEGNVVKRNIIYQEFEVDQVCILGNDDNPFGCHKYGISFNGGKEDMEFGRISKVDIRKSMINNTISHNYLYANKKIDNWNGNGVSRSLRYFSGALDTNSIQDNNFYYERENDKNPFDPYWTDFDIDLIGSRTVKGDFDGNGIDDIAAFQDLGNCESAINVWLGRADSLFEFYPDSWWNTNDYGGGYCLASAANRFVSGDFDGDGSDDIAVFYEYGSSSARIHVFRSVEDRNSFQFDNGSSGWWNSEIDLGGGYSLENVADRMVSGDFDNDGDDDIATFYKYGECDSRIHVFKSNGDSKFSFTSSSSGTWWDTSVYGGGYCLDAIDNRIVTGDFNGDDFDDIATFYKYGSSDARIHVFLNSKSNSFSFSRGSSGWWNNQIDLGGGYILDNISNRFVSGDFDGDGVNDDISTFYKYNDCESRIHTFISNGSDFTLSEGVEGWWSSQSYGGGYCIDQVGNSIIAGNFIKTTVQGDDIITFYKHGSKRVRTHFFQNNVGNGNESFMYSGALGMIWLEENSIASQNGRYVVENVLSNFDNYSASQSNITVYPNPSSDYFSISFESNLNEMVQIKIYSIQGELIKEISKKAISRINNLSIYWDQLQNVKMAVVSIQTSSYFEQFKLINLN